MKTTVQWKKRKISPVGPQIKEIRGKKAAGWTYRYYGPYWCTAHIVARETKETKDQLHLFVLVTDSPNSINNHLSLSRK